MNALRPLAWGLAAAAAGAALMLALPGAAPRPTAAAAEAAPPSPVLRVIGLAAPTPAVRDTLPDTEPDAQADLEARARLLLARDPGAALPLLEALARLRPDRALPLYEQLLARWAGQRRHAQAAEALARAPLPADVRERLLQALLAHWADAAPGQAARWALDTPGRVAWLAPLHDRWLQHDARAATVFASMLPPGDTRQALLDEGLSRWTAQDGPGARDWLRALAPLPALDDAIARHATADELARHAPAEAMDLVARIAAPHRRWQAWQALARSLHDIAPDQVAPLLAQAPGLGEAERQRLLDELR